MVENSNSGNVTSIRMETRLMCGFVHRVCVEEGPSIQPGELATGGIPVDFITGINRNYYQTVLISKIVNREHIFAYKRKCKSSLVKTVKEGLVGVEAFRVSNRVLAPIGSIRCPLNGLMVWFTWNRLVLELILGGGDV